MVLPEKLEKMNEVEFRAEMVRWIRENYSTVLGKEVNLLNQKNGLELVQQKVHNMLRTRGIDLARGAQAAKAA